MEFCDTDSSDTDKFIRHNSKAVNNQNIYCEGKSAWEVMREHSDFKGKIYHLNKILKSGR